MKTGLSMVQMVVIKNSWESFRQIIIDFSKRLIKALKPIKAEIKTEIKKIKFQPRCHRIRIIGNHIISIKNKTKKRYRNIARAKLLLKRWDVTKERI